MHKGKIKEYSSNRGYGSVIDSNSGEQFTVFANYTDLKEGQVLKEGQDVEYEIEYQRGGNWAVHVRFVGE